MPRSRRTNPRQGALERLRGGAPSPTLVDRQVNGLKRQWLAEISQESKLRQQAAKSFGALTRRTKPDPKQAQAIDDLKRVTERLAKQKLRPRRPRIGLPDTYGNYTLKFTPPYLDLGTSSVGQISSVTGDPTIEASGVDAIGQLTCSVDTNFDKPSAGTASNLLGVFFKPMFDNAKARITFDSSFDFAWYVNSIQSKLAHSRAQGLIRLMQFDGAFQQPSLASGAFIGWSQVAENALDFHVFSSAGPTWALEAAVNSHHFYLVVITLECSASGAGWPGSLAGAKAVVTVPSISVHITGQPTTQA
jgi:hypothetical protein